ncbi:MAG: outer membrane protein assembly factor BamE [Gammaproteobacteria bacterium]|nr:outer membrane protein assembly factor BamE [Gammaproteobacteria bacterium]MDH5736548.1 outer membrane protein assembly factor BamE [Gammaproteobacteria bacterium]
MHKLATPFILTLLIFTTGCTALLPEPHKLDIQQGNRIKQENVSKLKLGMTRKQVVFILGTPLLKDGFHYNRWDYIDYFKPGKGDVQQSRLSLIFDGDRLTKIDDSHYIQLPEQDTSNTTD